MENPRSDRARGKLTAANDAARIASLIGNIALIVSDPCAHPAGLFAA